MATYECEKCSHVFEIDQKITDPPRKRCPECRGKVVRLISGGAGIAFAQDGDQSYFQVFFIRSGKVVGREGFTLQGTRDESEKAIMTGFVNSASTPISASRARLSAHARTTLPSSSVSTSSTFSHSSVMR